MSVSVIITTWHGMFVAVKNNPNTVFYRKQWKYTITGREK